MADIDEGVRVRVGVEVGGTFTDLIAVDEDGNLAATRKVFSSPGDPSVAVLQALTGLRKQHRVDAPLIHGSTVATNAVIERKGARVGLITTFGFRDILETQRQDRERIYDLHYVKPEPLVPRNLVREIPERVSADGAVETPLDKRALEVVARELLDEGVTAIAICFLHAYQNPVHERRACEIIREIAPGVPVSISSDTVAEFREYERASTTVIDAFVKPVVERYVEHLEIESAELGMDRLWIMQSNGGILPGSYARELPVRTLYSGPAAGVTGALAVAREAGIENIITVDMGGTSTDVCLVTEGEPGLTSDAFINRLPLKMPMIDIVSVGAGGGSIAWLDSGGMLQVGPRSAGADPGPACYGLGGLEPTTTDANVARGLIRQEHFLGGEHRLDLKAAENAIGDLAARSGIALDQLPEAIYRISCATMAGALRVISVERGHDPRDYTLVAYGGAGPLHAATVAGELNITRVLVPPYPGLMSAYGLLVGDFKLDFSRTVVSSLGRLSLDQLGSRFAELEHEAFDQLGQQCIDPEDAMLILGLDMRYRGQGFEITIPIQRDDLLDDTLEAIEDRFHEQHRFSYGHSTPDEEVEAVTYRLSVIIEYAKPAALATALDEPRPPEPVEIMLEAGQATCNFYWRLSLRPGDRFHGPAVVEEATGTTFIPAAWTCHVDQHANLILERSDG